MNAKKVLVTGGAGFIGSAVIRHILENTSAEVVNLDKLTYAGNLDSLKRALEQPKAKGRYSFEKVDICDSAEVDRVFNTQKPDAVLHLAAESHVDRSIEGPRDFIQTNIIGTYTMLQAARKHWSGLENKDRSNFVFHHVSTDEVFGSLGETGLFTEETPFKPNSPYSASKASSDHLVRAWHHTYGLPVVITNCSNNYGPYHFPEKLIPLVAIKAMRGEKLPVYGKGDNVRDWLFVEDHARAIWAVMNKGRNGETYNIGGHNEKTNLEVVETICSILDELKPRQGGQPHKNLIEFVKDRPGHDLRYAIDSTKVTNEIGWVPQENFETGLKKTIKWYLDNSWWWERVMSGAYRGERLGLS